MELTFYSRGPDRRRRSGAPALPSVHLVDAADADRRSTPVPEGRKTGMAHTFRRTLAGMYAPARQGPRHAKLRHSTPPTTVFHELSRAEGAWGQTVAGLLSLGYGVCFQLELVFDNSLDEPPGAAFVLFWWTTSKDRNNRCCLTARQTPSPCK